MKVERQGEGSPLLLIHGLGGVGRYWDPLLPRLSERFDVLTVDLPGFGGSPSLAGRAVTAADLADALDVLLDTLDLPEVHVVGHSLGGFVAFELAALGRARSVTALAPAGLWARDHQADRSRRRLEWGHRLVRLSRPVGRPFVGVVSRVAPLPHGLTGAGARALYDSYSAAPGFDPVLRGVTGAPFTRADKLGGVPITVIFGSKDTVIVPEDRNRERLPAHTRWVDLPGAGHNVPWERRSDVVRTIVETTGESDG